VADVPPDAVIEKSCPVPLSVTVCGLPACRVEEDSNRATGARRNAIAAGVQHTKVARAGSRTSDGESYCAVRCPDAAGQAAVREEVARRQVLTILALRERSVPVQPR